MSALSSRVDLATARIHSDDADRQTETAQEILRRLESQPGVVLADDVGMGKTFVALAVAVSLLESQGRDRPVVVMVPSSVKDKWPRDWAVFESLCLNGAGAAIRTTEETVERPGQFLKLFDDPPERRRHLIFATHRALSNMHADPWIDLALVRQALLWQRDLDLQWNALPRWAGRLFPNAPAFKDEDLVWSLLEKPPSQWRATCRSAGRELDDDPVPRALVEACKHVDFAALREVLGRMPLKSSASIDARLRSLSRELKDAIRGLWPAILENASVSSPLLVLDEAHHLRNPNKLAQLFEAFGDGETPVLGDTFDRMLFLTATPFQLGHRELVAVIHRFSAVRWQDPSQRDAFDQQVDGLAAVLDGFRSRTLELDRAWGRLDPAEVEAVEAADPHWWDGGDRTRLPDRMQSAARCVAQARSMRAVVEAHLRPWVVRHTKANEPGHIALLPGRSILPNTGDHRGGLAVEGEAVLPFLLAARAQAEVAADRESKARALFADGLASSFEAYLYTRADAAEACDEDAGTPVPADVPTDIDWYLNRIDQALRPDGDGTVAARHPKLDATVERVVDLWRSGEKTVVFCFFVATGRALRDRIAAGLGSEILRRGAIALGLAPERTREVQATLERIGDRFHRRDSPLRERSESVLRRLVRDAAAGNLTEDDVERVMRIALRFIRTPSFLVRYFDLGADVDAGAIDAALERKDASGLTLSTKIAAFAAFAAGRVDAEREVLFAALEQVQTGTLWVDAAAVDDTETIGSARLPNVRLANGRVKDETRRRLMLAFNTPFFPEVLVASAVMAEGIDLHLDCRHVIHHDLDWNPSVVDQRTGRVDRIGSKAERTAKPIVVYEPFVEGTQDEKQFKVLTDRGHWFGVLMGERLELDESTTDELAARVPLPADLADELTVRLHVYDGTGATEPASPPPPERDPDEVEDLLALLDEHADELPTAVAEAAAKLMGT
ncbi:MAG: DEAD/DEAH box helicase, partial [Acidimicrobiia bacterium]|nr:DEAD/DEAH box helicase [Acidimicrobiia bacterium]